MSGISNISWTDRVWNPTVGCDRVSPGCAHCYAKALHDKRHTAFLGGKLQALPQYAQPFETVQLMWNRLHDPYSWRQPQRIFVNSVSDLFHEAVPDGFLVRVWLTMARCQQHTFQILTKRPQRMRDFVSRWADLTGETSDFTGAHGPAATRAAHPSGRGQLFAAMLETLGEPPAGAAYPTFDWAEGPKWWPRWLPNVWLGVSVENQRMANERLPQLLATPAGVRFLSCEPLLGPVVIGLAGATPIDAAPHRVTASDLLHWVILGGESGAGHRPMDPAWAESLAEECTASRVPLFVKQDSGPQPGRQGRLSDALWACKEFPDRHCRGHR